jgi:peptide-methionine (S)-S-oxide reductase
MRLSGAHLRVPTEAEALPGRAQRMPVAPKHFVLGTPMELSPEALERLELAMFGMGCFWGAEKKFWELTGVHSTAVGYAAGHSPNPSYEEVCSGRTGHTEVVRVAFDPEEISYGNLLKAFWENHDPTQGMQQGNDTGTQYRSGLYTYGESQLEAARASREAFEKVLSQAGYGPITTELQPAPEFYFAEDYHQQYLAKNPRGYCGMGGTGLSAPDLGSGES